MSDVELIEVMEEERLRELNRLRSIAGTWEEDEL